MLLPSSWRSAARSWRVATELAVRSVASLSRRSGPENASSEQDDHEDPPCRHELAVVGCGHLSLQQRARDRHPKHVGQREHEGGEHVGILADEGEPAGAIIRMGRNQPRRR